MGVLLYFLVIPHRVDKERQLVILSIVFIATYLIPLLVLLFLKSFTLITSFQVESIQERKIPIIFMIILFYLLGNFFYRYNIISDLGLLFYATALSLGAVYCLFFLKIKTSLHLLSIGSTLGFFLILGIYHTISLTLVYSLLILIAGFLASARLYLKAHRPYEIYIGFFLGILCQFLVFYFYRI